MEINCRKADLSIDGQTLFEIDNLAFTRDFDIPARNREEEVNYLKNCETFIYFDGQKALGICAWLFHENNEVELRQLCVIPEYQGKGVGKMMIADFLKRVGGRKAFLIVHPKNTVGLMLYLKNGFIIEEWKDNYYHDGQPRLYLERK
jgi:ribosomal protein S18 acetylase RimI-like enzyme